MKRPPIPIIINLFLLTVGYLYSVYLLIEEVIHQEYSGVAIALLIPLLFLTFGIIGTYIAIFKRHARSILLLGTFLLLVGVLSCYYDLSASYYRLKDVMIVCLFLITGVLFFIWGILLFRNINQPENTSIKNLKKYKYLLYSATIFCVASICFCILIRQSYENGRYEYHQFPQNTYFPIMYSLLIIGIVQFVIYYMLCKIRAYRENKMEDRSN